MNQFVGGVVLPESVLSSWWFQVLAMVVAFNTIVYLGLTLAKLIPLPKQIHPSRVRVWLRTLGTDPDRMTAVDEIPPSRLPETGSPYEDMRNVIAKRDTPLAFALLGGAAVILSVAALIAYRDEGRWIEGLMELVTGLSFLFAAQVFAHRDFRARTVMWSWAIACVVLVEVLIAASVLIDSQTPLGYTLIVMTAFATITLAWHPTFVACSIMFISFSVASFTVNGTEDMKLVVAAAAAIGAGLMLLRLRLVALDALSDEQAKSRALATTDVLTGALSRNGLLTLMPGLAGLAERNDEEICVMVLNVNQLAKANAQYGTNYGDDVLREVAESIRKNVREGDYVARWGGDEFLVAGLGQKPAADVLAARMEESVRISGINLGRWPTTIRVGTAAGSPRQFTFDDLVSEATLNARQAPYSSDSGSQP